jgi:serine/threonine protein kinase
MSEVYLALLQGGLGGFQKLIAVKLLRRDLAEDESFRRMFLDEARLTAQLNHPNVVQTNDVGEDRGRYYIAMEYLEGQTFERARRARNAGKLFPVNLQLAMLADVLAGLHYAHELVDYDGSPLAIVHRDVTPSNVFITYDGQVKLVDFGIAKVLDSLNPTVRVGTVDRPKHPAKAIIMVGTYKACARFIQKIRDHKLDALVLNVSFVGSNALADELKELGPGYGNGVIVTQVVPHFDSGATGIIHFREALQKYHPDQAPDFVSLEGYIVGQLFAEGLRRAGRELDTEKLVDALERVQDFDPGTGGTLTFSMSRHQASNKVWATMLDEHGVFRSIDME